MKMLKVIPAVLVALLLMGEARAQSLHSLAKELPCVNQNFNVFYHVALDSLRETGLTQAEIDASLSAANKFFAPICITFTFCGIDTMENYNFDSLAQQSESNEWATLYPGPSRLNIYVSGELHEPEICGYAGTGGKVVLKKGCGGSLVHELGHFFGLPHTFAGNGTENVDGSNCETAGDGICDTPADPYDPDAEFSYQDGCTFTWTGLDANGQFYQPDMGNIMSYYDCDCGFTRGQYLRMVEVYNSTIRKLW